MNKAEALSILGLDSSASEEEIKKKFRKLAYEKHPDRNKSEEAEEEYKKISEAFEYLKNPLPEPNWTQEGFNISFREIFGDFINNDYNFWNQRRAAPSVHIPVLLTFEESILGCNKKITISRNDKCNVCNGNGFIIQTNICSACNGQGYFVNQNSMLGGVFQVKTICSVCNGTRRDRKNCEICSNTGSVPSTKEFDVKLKGGLKTGNSVRLPGAGHYFKSMEYDNYDNAYLDISVTPEPNMNLVGQDVVSNLEISLLEALKGTKKKVETVLGEITLMIRPGSKHKDQLKINGYGVNRVGNHVFVLNILYPKEQDDLIKFLEQKEK